MESVWTKVDPIAERKAHLLGDIYRWKAQCDINGPTMDTDINTLEIMHKMLAREYGWHQDRLVDLNKGLIRGSKGARGSISERDFA